jgi:nuclear pore complex protein Nup98-Nup96
VVDAGGYAAASEAAIADQSPHAPCARVVCERFAPRRRSSGDAAALRAALEVALEMTAGDEARAEDRNANGDARFGKRRRLRCSRLELPGLCDRYMRAVEARLATGPALSLPRALDPSELAMEVSAWDLVKTLWGDEPGGAPGGSAADRHRRRAKLGAWLRKQNGAAVGSGDAFAVKAATGAPVAATRAAAATGHPRLATLIAQGGCGGAGAALASAQLAVWRGSAVEKYVPAAASSALGVLAGEVAPPRADLPVRDWRVNFGLHVWHGASPTATIARVLDGYLDAVADGAAARPDAPGFSDATPREHLVDARADRLRETCFNLLVLFATGADALREAGAAGAMETRKMFHPLTYCAADLANAAFAWRVFCALRAVGALGDGDDVERLGDDLAVRFACQLDGFGSLFGSLEPSTSSTSSEHSSLAEWTVFVLMHVADGPRRAAAVRGTLRRRCAEWRSDERKRKFLVERAGAPLAWLEDAEASFLKFHAARYDVS